MNLIDIRPDSEADVAEYIAEQTAMDLATRHFLTLLFSDFDAATRFVDEQIRKAGLKLTGEVPD
jgi:hypothetical protein